MNKTNFTTRPYITKNGRIMLRVRWDKKKQEVGFGIGYTIDPVKWDGNRQLVKNNTTHKIKGRTVYASEINNVIRDYLVCIEEAFAECDFHSAIMTKEHLKNYVNNQICRNKNEKDNSDDEEMTLTEIFNDFMAKRPLEGSWSDNAKYKYQQMFNQLKSYDKKIELKTLTSEKLVGLSNWYIKNDYCNRTVVKQFKILKSFLRWALRNGHKIQPGVLDFKPKLKVIPQIVTFLKYNELMHFASFEFPPEKAYLSKARDMFCFMAFTSLRYSDLAALKPVNIVDGRLEIITEKTDDKLFITLNEHAQKIIDKYSWYKGETVFPVPTNQKLNETLKEAAKLAGLDREIVQVYFKGNTRYEKICKFWEQISCHDARRTFVCCSLALGIPTSVVMSCTGHSDYESMKPYIEVADETQKMEMEKWNNHQYKQEILESVDKMTTEQLKEVCKFINQKIKQIS